MTLRLLLGASILAGILPLASGGTLRAQTPVLQENFESHDTGKAPGAPWSVEGLSITVTPGHEAQSAFGPGGDTLGARLRDMNGTGVPALQRGLEGGSLPLTVSFDFMFAQQKGNPHLVLLEGSSQALSLMLTDTEGHPSVKGSDGFHPITAISLEPHQWYRFTLTIPKDAKGTFDLKIESADGKAQTATGLPFASTPSGVDAIRFTYNTVPAVTGGEYFLDNVEVTHD